MTPYPKPQSSRVRLKTCANPGCRKKYEPRPGALLHEVWCGYDCAVAISRIRQTKELKRKRQEWNRETQERKRALKTNDQLWRAELKSAEKAVCLYVRVRDAREPCISCGRSAAQVEAGPYRAGGYWDGGHYKPKSTHPELRFNTWNIHKQCKSCNGGENYVRNSAKMASVKKGYDAGLTEKIGAVRVANLHAPRPPLQPDIEYLHRMKRIFNRRARHLKKLRGYE